MGMETDLLGNSYLENLVGDAYRLYYSKRFRELEDVMHKIKRESGFRFRELRDELHIEIMEDVSGENTEDNEESGTPSSS